MKTNNILITLAITVLLAIGAGLWFTRRKDTYTATGTGIRNIAPEATLTTSSTHPDFNEKTILQAAIPANFSWGAMGWNDASQGVFPDWVELAWPVPMSITQVVIASLGGTQQPFAVGTGMDGQYGLRDFTVQAYVGGAWSTIATAQGNTKDKTVHNLASAVTTQKIRVTITDTQDHLWSRITNVQVTGQEA